MSDWSKPSTRLVGIHITRGAARAAGAFPPPAVVTEERHVGAGYQVVLPSGRIVHEGGLTLHGPAGELELPADLAAAVELLWAHAEQQVAAQEGLDPA